MVSLGMSLSRRVRGRRSQHLRRRYYKFFLDDEENYGYNKGIKEKKMDIEQNPVLTERVEGNTPLKEWLVNYVGEKQFPEIDEVTTEMIVETLATEFPEFLMAVAEENWIRGYHQAMKDVEIGEHLLKELANLEETENGIE